MSLNDDAFLRSNWLGRYLGVERKFDKKLKAVLLDAVTGIDKAFGDLSDDQFSQRVRRTQLSQSHKAIRSVIKGIFGETTNLIKDGQQDAAVAAVDSELVTQRGVLSRIFKDPTHREQYADSLRQTAKRNIDAVVTRVLETERPLSARVYKTQALSNGRVSQEINRALARGDSARTLAKNVRDLIDPNTPGGVSYAAKRLGRTEINNAFHAQSINDAQETPWVESMEWHLSQRHELDPGDECEEYDGNSFAADKVPEKPHPNCRCFVTPNQPAYDDFEKSLLSGEYDDYLEQVLGPEAATAREIAEQPFSPKIQEQYEKALAAGKHDMGFPPKGLSSSELSEFQKANVKLAKIALEREAKAEEVWAAAKIVDDVIPDSIDDAENALQVANYLTNKYDGLEVSGFDFENVDVRAAREIGRAFEARFADSPHTNIRALRVVDDLPSNTAAETRFNQDGKQFSDIVFNRRMLADYKGAVATAKQNQKILKGHKLPWHTRCRSPEKPWEGTFDHEWGHVLSYSGGTSVERSLVPIKDRKFAAGQKVGHVLSDEFMRSIDLVPDVDDQPIDFDERYDEWFMSFVQSEYSLKKDLKTLDPPEFIAESYAAVINDGGNEVSNAIHRLLLDAVNDNESLKIKVRKPSIKKPAKKAVPEKLTWTGPKVGKPLKYKYPKPTLGDRLANPKAMENHMYDEHKLIHDDAISIWISDRFDETKDLFRSGAREAQRTGRLEFDPELLEYIKSHPGQYGDPRDAETIAEYGKEMVSFAVHSKPTEDLLYRGMALKPQDAAKLVEGQDISMPLSSFIEYKSDAESFALQTGWVSTDVPEGATKAVVLQVEPGAKFYDLEDGERIGFGQFRILKVTETKDIKYVSIKQISMLESDLDVAKSVPSGGDMIPDITIIEPKDKPNIPIATPRKTRAKKVAQKASATGLSGGRDAVREIKKLGISAYIDDYRLTPEFATELVDAVRDMKERYPEVKVHGIEVFSFFDGHYGETKQWYPIEIQRPGGKGTFVSYSSNINLNAEWTSDNRKFLAQAQQDELSGWHYIGSAEKPVLSTYYHEFGHAIYNALGSEAPSFSEVERELFWWYNDNVAARPEMLEAGSTVKAQRAWAKEMREWEEGFDNWKRQLSGYSFITEDLLAVDGHEALSEAFDVVERMGDKAPEPAKVLHRLLVDKYNELFPKKKATPRKRVAKRIVK